MFKCQNTTETHWQPYLHHRCPLRSAINKRHSYQNTFANQCLSLCSTMSAQLLLLLYCQLHYNPTHEASYWNRRNGLTGIIFVTIPNMKPGTEIDETDWRASLTLQSHTWSQVPKSTKRTDGHNLRYNPTHEARYRNRRNRLTGIIYVTIPNMKPGTEISLHQRNSLHTTDQPHKASHAKAACHQSDHLLIISLLILLVCVSWPIIGQPQNSVFNLFICRVQPE